MTLFHSLIVAFCAFDLLKFVLSQRGGPGGGGGGGGPGPSASDYNCNTTYSCSNQTIDTTNSLIGAHGYKSANGALTSLKSSKSDVSCSAQEACIDGQLIRSDEFVYCSGESSCKNVKNMTGREFQCLGTDSCSQSTADLGRQGDWFVFDISRYILNRLTVLDTHLPLN